MTKRNRKITSIRALAKALRRSHVAVRANWLTHPAWPFAKSPPWDGADVPRMKAWAATAFEQQPEPTDPDTAAAMKDLSPERQAKLALVIERTAKVKLERELLAGRYIPRERVESDLLGRATEARRTLEAITSLAPRLAGRDEQHIRGELEAAVEHVCRLLSEGGK